MNEKSESQLKAELLTELSNAIQSKVEQEVEEELKKTSLYSAALHSSWKYFIAVAATIMALGQFSEAVTLIEDGVTSLRSRFTNSVEYERLSRVHVGNTESYIDNLLGNPQVSKAINDNIVAKYYFDEKFLLTVFIDDQRVTAYTAIPFVEDFRPTIVEEEDFSWVLLSSTYASFPANPKLYMVDHSKTASYYIEILDTGRTGLFLQNYLGNVAFGASADNSLVVDLYNKEVTGTPEEILETQNRLRKKLAPNLYGIGKLELELVQRSILTGAEFATYFGQ